MKTISLNKAKIMLKGASILSCGGGLSYAEQLKYLNSLTFKKKINVLDIDDLNYFSNKTVFITASELGPADNPPINKSKINEMINLFSKKFHKQVGGIIPVEIGQETIVFDSAIRTGLPVVNTDLAGLRAVPKASLNALTMQKFKFTRSPLIILTNTEDIILMEKNGSLEVDETELRQLAKKTKGVIFIIGGFITAPIIKKYLTHQSLTVIYKIGKKIEEKKNFVKEIPLIKKYQVTGKVTSIFHKNSLGFSEKKVLIMTENTKNKQFNLIIKNEYVEFSNDKMKFKFPQLITIYNKKLNRGLSSSELTKNTEIDVTIFDPLPFWKNFKNNL